MAYYCRVERDSVGPFAPDNRLTTFVITFPRIVLAETVTHRTCKDLWGEESWCERTTDEGVSKNSASSRAIPYDKMAQRIKDDPYMPKWTMNQKGMQGVSLEEQDRIDRANWVWLRMCDACLEGTAELHTLGVHKQDVNRPLETWAWVTQVVTSSRWDNYFALRCHDAAHPAFRHIARMMYLARRNSTPQRLQPGQWHLPFVPLDQQAGFTWHPGLPYEELEDFPPLVRSSAARCAWTSYENHDRDGTQEACDKTWARLFAEVPIHASPLEHQCCPMMPIHTAIHPHLRSNLTGWLQARKLLRYEEVKHYSPSQEEIDGWGMKEYE